MGGVLCDFVGVERTKPILEALESGIGLVCARFLKGI